jgi:FMN phosphatase YigB (HAD superfamily)
MNTTLFIFDWGRTLYDPEHECLFEHTKATLSYLQEKGHTLCVVALATAGQEKIAERQRIIEKENLGRYFVSVQFDVENKDAMYVRALEMHGVAPHDVVIVDDRVVRGIAWGNAHGCTTVWVQNGKFADELPDEKTGMPTYTIREIGELRNLF